MKRTSSVKSKTKESKIKYSEVPESSIAISSSIATASYKENSITMTAYYNSKDQLVEIAFTSCPFEINRRIIQAINICLPFHKFLHRLRIKRSLTQTVLYEISKLLPHSNITDVCLDDNFLPQGNYYLLLDNLNNVQNLSLRRCDINDEACKSIANKMNFGCPASNTLITLNLASNCITDIGATHLGMMLRQNRTLLYLNVSDNKITDSGAINILNNFRVFPLTKDEIIARNYRKVQFFKKRNELYRKYVNEITNRLREEEEKENINSFRMLLKGERIQKRKTTMELSVAEQAEKMTTEIIGEFKDMYDDNNIIREDGQIYAIGNLRLSYLNLAYNNLGYFSVRKIYDVLKYQSNINKPVHCSGLLKIILEGNNIPDDCEELRGIQYFLESAITENIPLEVTRCKSSLKSRKKLNNKNMQII
ncbi:unnamed protein product [Euphydryas editha]|uniref:Uncharacterized protein n=1 Tax=Euphydryas editha TaxID=104508 RepID=A0AAU9U7F3_EUPED|nr:unnamed protein product [Euphydryas editha]